MAVPFLPLLYKRKKPEARRVQASYMAFSPTENPGFFNFPSKNPGFLSNKNVSAG